MSQHFVLRVSISQPRHQINDAAFDLVPDCAKRLGRHISWIGKSPILPVSSRHRWAGIPAPHCDHIVEGTGVNISQPLRRVCAQVVAALLHGFDRRWVHPAGWSRACARSRDDPCGVHSCECLSHLASIGVLRAHEENTVHAPPSWLGGTEVCCAVRASHGLERYLSCTEPALLRRRFRRWCLFLAPQAVHPLDHHE